MDVRLIVDQPRDGKLNMGIDEALLELAADASRPVLRLYAWSSATLSLGYFQQLADRQGHRESLGCELVRRSTGGGAILHDRELTYSFAWPSSPRCDPRPWYELFHRTLRETLRQLGAEAELCAADAERRGGRAEPFLCFQRRAAGDLLLGAEKIAGSAQRRRRGAALQHGSILWQRSPRAPQLPGIADLRPGLATPAEFQRLWLDRLGGEFSSLDESVLSQQELDRGAEFARSRFGSAAWSQRR